MFDFETTIDGHNLFVEVREFSYHPGHAWYETNVDAEGWFDTLQFAILDEEGKEIDLDTLPNHVYNTLEDEVEEQCIKHMEEQAAKEAYY